MATHSVTSKVGVDLDAVDSSPVHTLGEIVCTSNGAEYQYVRADEALAQYAAVKIDDDFECSELTTTLSGAEPTRVGVPQIAFADTEYGWVAISGPLTVLAAANCAADVKVYTTATAGVIDDAATDLVQGLKLTAACGGAQAATAAFASCRMVTNSQD